MSFVVVGLNHRTVPVELLERMTVPPAGLPKALHSLALREHLAEVVLLSTCNRTEVYARTTLFHPGVDDVRHFLADQAGMDPDELADLLYTYHDDAAVAHLFGVAAGLDSMIIGEGEILGQVREAWQVAEREGAVGQCLSRTFRHAVEVGKRARTETGIGRHAVSVPSAAVSVATGTARFARRAAGPRPRRRRRRREDGDRALGRRRGRDRRRQPHGRARAMRSRRGSADDPSRSTRSPTRWSASTSCSRAPVPPTC